MYMVFVFVNELSYHWLAFNIEHQTRWTNLETLLRRMLVYPVYMWNTSTLFGGSLVQTYNYYWHWYIVGNTVVYCIHVRSVKYALTFYSNLVSVLKLESVVVVRFEKQCHLICQSWRLYRVILFALPSKLEYNLQRKTTWSNITCIVSTWREICIFTLICVVYLYSHMCGICVLSYVWYICTLICVVYLYSHMRGIFVLSYVWYICTLICVVYLYSHMCGIFVLSYVW